MSGTYPIELCKKLHKVMEAVEYLKKDKTNEGQKYKYLSEAAIKNRLHAELAKNGVLILPVSMTSEEAGLSKTSKAGNTSLTVAVKLTCAFVDIETGESIEVSSVGYGEDYGDKGVYKAITGALKYLLTTSFLIETGDDPEDDSAGITRKLKKEKQAKVQPETLTPEEQRSARELLIGQIKNAYNALPEEKKQIGYYKSMAGIVDSGKINERTIQELQDILKVFTPKESK